MELRRGPVCGVGEEDCLLHSGYVQHEVSSVSEAEQYASIRTHSKATAVYHNILNPKPASRVLPERSHRAGGKKPDDNAVMPMNINAASTSRRTGRLCPATSMPRWRQTELHDNAKFTALAKCGEDVFSAVVSDGIDVRIPVEINVTEVTENNVNMLSGLSYDENAPLDNSKFPSLVVARPNNQDSLWHMAKKYRSTPNLILAANELEGEEDIAPGQLLIIPKK